MIQTTVQIPTPPPLDPNYVFSQIIPLIGIIGVVIALSFAVRAIFRSPVGEALAQRIREGRRRHHGGEIESSQAHAMLEDKVNQLQEQVGELAERLDFAERMLAERRERQLGGPGS
jgi:hypothetical protein